MKQRHVDFAKQVVTSFTIMTPSARKIDLSADDILALTDENIIKIADQENPNWREYVEMFRQRINKLIEDNNVRN